MLNGVDYSIKVIFITAFFSGTCLFKGEALLPYCLMYCVKSRMTKVENTIVNPGMDWSLVLLCNSYQYWKFL